MLDSDSRFSLKAASLLHCSPSRDGQRRPGAPPNPLIAASPTGTAPCRAFTPAARTTLRTRTGVPCLSPPSSTLHLHLRSHYNPCTLRAARACTAPHVLECWLRLRFPPPSPQKKAVHAKLHQALDSVWRCTRWGSTCRQPEHVHRVQHVQAARAARAAVHYVQAAGQAVQVQRVTCRQRVQRGQPDQGT